MDDPFAPLTKYSTNKLAWPPTRPGQQDPSRADRFATHLTKYHHPSERPPSRPQPPIFLHDLLSRPNLHERPFLSHLSARVRSEGLILSTPPSTGDTPARIDVLRNPTLLLDRQVVAALHAGHVVSLLFITPYLGRLRSICCGEPPIFLSLARFVRSFVHVDHICGGNSAVRSAWFSGLEMFFPLFWEVLGRKGMPHPSSPSS